MYYAIWVIAGNHDHHCELCGKGFTVRSALRAHMRTHTKDKPYVCPVCGRGFSHSSSLKPHIAIHSDECPFECDRCDRKFKTKKTLTHHIQSHDLDEGKGLQCGICFKVLFIGLFDYSIQQLCVQLVDK